MRAAVVIGNPGALTRPFSFFVVLMVLSLRLASARFGKNTNVQEVA